MKIEKITENKIRIVVNLEELLEKKIGFNDFVLNNRESQKFFLEVLNKAEKEIGFITKDCKLLIETFSSLDEIFVFTITKFSELRNNKYSPKLEFVKKIPVVKTPIFQFSSFEEFCALCVSLKSSEVSINDIAKRISLYLYNGTYYIVLSNLNLAYSNLSKIFSILSEFATIVKQTNNFEAKLIEYGQPIIKQNAFKTGIKYFV